MKYEKFDITLSLKDGVDENQQASVDFYILDTPESMTAIRKRPIIIVNAGGAYAYRSQRESEPIVMKFLAAGYHCALMNYSVAPAKWPCAARELAHAVAIARQHAEEWKIREDGVFISGFSAGGHLATTLATIWDDPAIYAEFGVERPVDTAKDFPAWRPNGAILCYPVITMLEYTHEGSRDNLLGENAPQELREALSLERRVSAATVPAFIWHTGADGSVPVENSLQYAVALRKAGVPFELHVFEHGGHGLSLCNTITSTGAEQLVPENEPWIDLAVTWVKGRMGKLSELE